MELAYYRIRVFYWGDNIYIYQYLVLEIFIERDRESEIE